jgi:hypothetical protein
MRTLIKLVACAVAVFTVSVVLAQTEPAPSPAAPDAHTSPPPAPPGEATRAAFGPLAAVAIATSALVIAILLWPTTAKECFYSSDDCGGPGPSPVTTAPTGTR